MQLSGIRADGVIVLCVCTRFVVDQLDLSVELLVEVVDRSQGRWQLRWWRWRSCRTRNWLLRSHCFWSLALTPSGGIWLWSLW